MKVTSAVPEQIILGIDAGGTFTDFVCVRTGAAPSITLHKTPSTPAAPELAILNGIRAMGLEALAKGGGLHIIHGSTVATNAVLEGKLAKTVFITNYGFGDLLQLARQTRPQLYALEFPGAPAPVPAELCLETGGRLGADGIEIQPLTEAEIADLLDQIETLAPSAVAINLLFSFLDDSSERRIEEALQQCLPDLFVSRSSRVLPEYKEYERGIATWLNAALGPVINGYLSRLRSQLGDNALQIMQSSGETIGASKAAEAAVNLLLSGPAGGLKAIQFIGEQTGIQKIISFDMGGTSTDVALIDGAIARTTEGTLAQYPVGVSMVDMHTIGAGGGSIARVDSGGMLVVGPQSAGAEPGPACYGKGGREATVTDANLVLGRLAASVALAGDMHLDVAAAELAIGELAEKLQLSIAATAQGIVTIANEHMAKAIRLISVNRGHDPNEFVLACFGGAGGLHVCALAEAMQMRHAIVPVHCGVLSALGMVVSSRGRQFSRTLGVRSSAIDLQAVTQAFTQLQQSATDELLQEGLQATELRAERSVDMRYLGQSYTLKIPWQQPANTIAEFHLAHEQRYGYALDTETELVNIRVQVSAEAAALSLPLVSTAKSDASNSEATSSSATETSIRGNKPPENGVYAGTDKAKVYARECFGAGTMIVGPAIITEYSATTFIAPGWSARVDDLGNLILSQVNPD